MARKKGLSAEEFIKAYFDNGYNVRDTAEFLDVHASGVYHRIKHYRKLGIKLPNPRSKVSRLDVNALNNYIKSLKQSQ